MGLKSLKNAAGAKTTASKSDTPVVQGSTEFADAIRDLKSAKKAEKDAKADIVLVEARMFPEAKALRRESCRGNKFTAAVRIEAGTETILATQQSRCKKMGEDASDPIRKIVGAKNYTRFFKEQTTYSFDEDAITDEMADAIVAALGDQVDKVLKVTTAIVPTEAFMKESVTDDKVEALALKLLQNGFAEPYKMSFK